MKQPALNKLMPRLLLSALGAGAWVALTTHPLMAQTTGAADLSNNSSDVSDSFGDSDGLDMFELMHRAQQGSIRSRSDFMRDQQQQIGSEAANFRSRQQQAIQQQQPGAVQSGTTQPTYTTPTTTQPLTTP